MKTIEQIKDLMIGKSVIADLADLLRANDTDFAESEKNYYAAVEKLRGKNVPPVRKVHSGVLPQGASGDQSQCIPDPLAAGR